MRELIVLYTILGNYTVTVNETELQVQFKTICYYRCCSRVPKLITSRYISERKIYI